MNVEGFDMNTNQTYTQGKTNGQSRVPDNVSDSARADGRDDDATMLPQVDVIEDPSGITVVADLAGVSKESLDVRVEADTLLIEGDITIPMPGDMTASHAEVEVTRYRRQFTLSKELDREKVDAAMNQGVLRIRIPKASDAQPRRIAVDVH